MATVSPACGELTEEMIEAAKAELAETDGEPWESPWRRAAIGLLIDCVKRHWRGRTDYYVGGNMFVYFSRQQARTRKYRGPDFFFVKNVDGTRPREYWWIFEEEGRYPDVIIELLSRTTAEEDRTTKKDLYEQVFHTPEYFCYDPEPRHLVGWRLSDGRYQPILPDERDWLWSEELGLWLGTWDGVYQNDRAIWLRFYDRDGQQVFTEAEAERQRAEALQAEVDRLKTLLAEKGTAPPGP